MKCPELNFPGRKKLSAGFCPLALLGILAVQITAASAVLAEDPIPAPYPPERYEPIWKKSPFTLSSAAPEATGTFADNIALVGIFKSEGEVYAAILDKTTQKRELVSSKANDKGIRVLQTESSNERDKVSVILEKNGEKATLRYDMTFLQASAAKAPANQPAVTAPNTPPVPGGPPPATRPPRRRLISSNPNGQASPGSPQPIPIPAPKNNQPVPARP